MSWQVVDRMTIYHESGMYALSPTVTRTPAGSLLVTFQRATYLGYSHHEHPLFNVQSCRSEDEGRTWTGPHLVTVDPRGGVMDRGVHTLPDGSIFLHSSCTELVPAEDAVEHGGAGLYNMANRSGSGHATMGIRGALPNAFHLYPTRSGDTPPSTQGSVGAAC